MNIDEATVRHIGRLARIKIDDAQVPGLKSELTAILGWVEQLNEIDTTDVEPMTSVEARSMRLRADVVTEGDMAADIVRNAPLAEDHFFVVPKVVE